MEDREISELEKKENEEFILLEEKNNKYNKNMIISLIFLKVIYNEKTYLFAIGISLIFTLIISLVISLKNKIFITLLLLGFLGLMVISLRNDVNSKLEDEFSECNYNGLYIGHENQHMDNHTFVDPLQLLLTYQRIPLM